VNKVLEGIKTELQVLTPRNFKQTWDNGWAIDMVVLKNKFIVSLQWIPVALLVISAICLLSGSINRGVAFFATGVLTYIIFWMYWMQEARIYIAKKEGIGKKPEEGK
jgi:hypothetical protein